MKNQYTHTETVYLPLRTVAEQHDFPMEYVKELCMAGVIECRSFGTTWLVERDSLLIFNGVYPEDDHTEEELAGTGAPQKDPRVFFDDIQAPYSTIDTYLHDASDTGRTHTYAQYSRSTPRYTFIYTVWVFVLTVLIAGSGYTIATYMHPTFAGAVDTYIAGVLGAF